MAESTVVFFFWDVPLFFYVDVPSRQFRSLGCIDLGAKSSRSGGVVCVDPLSNYGEDPCLRSVSNKCGSYLWQLANSLTFAVGPFTSRAVGPSGFVQTTRPHP